MRRIGAVGLCLVTLFAMSAVVATSASALEWGECYPDAIGHYNSNCTKHHSSATGPDEWRKGTLMPNTPFTDSGGAGVLAAEYIICEPSQTVRKPACRPGETEASQSLQVECTSENSTGGEVMGSNKVVKVSVVLQGCFFAYASVPCSNTANAGEVQISRLKGHLGYINKLQKEVGVLLEPEGAPRRRFAEFNCGNLFEVVVGRGDSSEGTAYPGAAGGRDGIISPITPVNAMTNTFTQPYTSNAFDENIPNKFGGAAPLELLESYAFNPPNAIETTKWSKAGLSLTNVKTTNATIEIKA